MDGSLALSFINLSKEKKGGSFTVDLALIKKYLGNKLPDSFYQADTFYSKNLWTGENGSINGGSFEVKEIDACGNITLKISPSEK